MINPLVAFGRATFEAADDADLEARVRALVTPDFVFRQEGRRVDVEGYLAHVRRLRSATAGGELTVLDELVDHAGTPVRVAVRVFVRMPMLDGSVTEGEALMIGRVAGERLAAVTESGRVLGEGDGRPV